MTEIGETVSRVDALIWETQAFQQICQKDIDKAEEVVATGKLHLIQFVCFVFNHTFLVFQANNWSASVEHAQKKWFSQNATNWAAFETLWRNVCSVA